MKKKTQFMVIVSAMVLLSLALFSCATAPPSKSEKSSSRTRCATWQTKRFPTSTRSTRPLKKPSPKRQAMRFSATSASKSCLWAGPEAGAWRWTMPPSTRRLWKWLSSNPGWVCGAAKYRVVFIFETMDAFNSFVTSGWEAGANAMASAKTKTEGGALAGAVTVSE